MNPTNMTLTFMKLSYVLKVTRDSFVLDLTVINMKRLASTG